MSIAEPFCKTYKPIVRADGSCSWDQPSSNSTIQECKAKEDDENIIYWDSQFNIVKKETSVVTEFNLVTREI